MTVQWPQSLDYFQAVQTPVHSFADVELQAAEVAVNELGLPQACAGNFADVYQFRNGDDRRSWAVKCFTRPVSRLAERYREISRHLEHARLSLTVEFKYLEYGIRIRGKWYPVLKMDWVDGQTLRQFVEEHLDAPEILRLLFDVWVKVESLLNRAQVAHGDLQHGNILLIPGKQEDRVALRLVDYDGMWVPALSGQPAHEFGHPAYQHPRRLKEKVYTAAIDRFPHLVIGCALHCLSHPHGLELWQRYDNGDNLLFTQADFDAPAISQLLQWMWESRNHQLRACAGHIAIAAQSPLESTPLLGKLFVDGNVLPLTPAEMSRARRLMGYAPRTKPPPVASVPAFHGTRAADPNLDWMKNPFESDRMPSLDRLGANRKRIAPTVPPNAGLTKICPSCGKTINNGAIRCRFCGKSLRSGTYRGLKILAISAFGFVCVLSLFCCALSPLFAVTALVMANHDLSEMAKGRMNRSGEGTTRAGKVMAIIQLAIVAAFFALYGASLLLRK